MKRTNLLIFSIMIGFLYSCSNKAEQEKAEQPVADDFQFQTEQFNDVRILRYRVKGFDALSLKQKELLYYLEQAAYCGREIFYDQNYKYNLAVKRTLEGIVEHYQGDRTGDDFQNFMKYTKRFWFSNGLHHHYSGDKFFPEISTDFFAEMINNSTAASFPLYEGESKEAFIERLQKIIFDKDLDNKHAKTGEGVDMALESAGNYYEGVTQKEVEAFYAAMKDPKNNEPISFGLNSKLVKEDGKIFEKVYKKDGLYSAAIEKIVYWLEKAANVAESELQKQIIEKLIEFYNTGNLATFDQYSKLWVKDTLSIVDFTNGFIEVYGDPFGMRGAYQSVVYIKDVETTEKFAVIADEAAWFEENSPIANEHKRERAGGISFKIINAVTEAGDCSPSSPLGVNLPNSEWIRSNYGSKSVSLGNIDEAYTESSKTSGLLQEFHTPDQVELLKQYGAIAGVLHTGLHEVIGHGSGKLEAGISVDALKNYGSPLEECRADLVALYYIIDPKLVELGISPSIEVGKAEYCNYIVNGLMKQLVRIEAGAIIEQAHMRNRSTIAQWCYEKGKSKNIIEKKIIEGKTFFVINDYEKLRQLFGELLKEVQRIKSQGDYEAGKKLIETYGVQINSDLHNEVLSRFKKLNIAAYAGFINPQLEAVFNEKNEIIDVKITYPDDFTQQMLFYAKKYAILPTYN